MDIQDTYSFLLVSAAYLLLAVSLVGCVIPVIPGAALAAAAVLGLKLCLPEIFGWGFVAVVCAVMLLVQAFDFLMSWFGAKKFGATWRGALGAVVGSLLGVFMQPFFVWIFVMPFVMAFAFEWLGGTELRKSLKSGAGAVLGAFLAMVVKIAFVCAVAAALTVRLFMLS